MGLRTEGLRGDKMNHLMRAGLVLGLLVASFLVFRSLVLQGRLSLPELGLRPLLRESNVRAWADRSLVFSTSKDCAGSRCHQETYDVWAPSAHGGASCETCHGPARTHVDNTRIRVPVDLQPQVCNLCHAEVLGRPTDFPQIAPADHYEETTCTSCHIAHRPGPAREVSHEVPEGSDCLFCHSASSPPDRAVPADHSGRTNQECLNCHEAAD